MAVHVASDLRPVLLDLAEANAPAVGLWTPRFRAERGDVLVGCGTYDAGWGGDVVFNNKAAGTRFGRRFSSVTAMLADAPEGLFESCPLWGERPLDVRTSLQRLRIVAEDASADSVFAGMILLARLAGAARESIPERWVHAIDQWERSGNADDPWTSWCALESALVHGFFPVGAQVADTSLGEAWRAALAFAAKCMLEGYEPNRVPSRPDWSEWLASDAALRQEQGVYHSWLDHADIAQFSLPIVGQPLRRMLVDGLTFVESQMTGTAKVFYRNDRVNAPLGSGFALSAHSRPTEAGTGNEYTIAVDPRAGVHLREVWAALEDRETKAWRRAGEQRPVDAPRLLENVASSANEPWFVTPDGSLVGAPRSLPDGQCGTRLSWDDVQAVIWDVANPLLHVEVDQCVNGEWASLPILAMRADAADIVREEGLTSKSFVFARWPRAPLDAFETDRNRALGAATIVPRIMAALVDRADSDDPIRLRDLPRPGLWTQTPLSGGFAIVTASGVFVFDDWTRPKLDYGALRRVFENAASLDKRLACIYERSFPAAMKNLDETIYRERWSPDNAKGLASKVARLGSQLAALRAGLATPPSDPDARILKASLEQQWGLEGRLRGQEEAVRSVESAMRSLSEFRLSWLTRLISIYGFSLLVAGAIADPVARSFDLWWNIAPSSEIPAPHILIAFCVVAAIFVIGMLIIVRRHDPAGGPDSDEIA